MIKALVLRYLDEHSLTPGTNPENLAAVRLHQWHHEFVQQHRIGRYRVDFAFPDVQVALEVDGPHHLWAEVALKDAWRDQELRSLGWVVLRVNAENQLEDQLARCSEIIHLLRKRRP